MWRISKEQLIFFPLMLLLHHVSHTWPSTLPLKMAMSFATFCKFCWLDRSVITKQCNSVAAEIVSSHARWSCPFWKFEQQGACNFSFVILRIFRAYLIWINGCLGNYLDMVIQDIQNMIHCCQFCVEIRGGYVEEVDAYKDQGRN